MGKEYSFAALSPQIVLRSPIYVRSGPIRLGGSGISSPRISSGSQAELPPRAHYAPKVPGVCVIRLPSCGIRRMRMKVPAL